MKLWLTFLGIMFSCTLVQAGITARFEPETVALGESTQLIFESDRPWTEEPDLSGLVGHFAVSNRQQGSQVIQINGRRRSRYTLALTVFPRHSGTISTGDFTVGKDSIAGARLQVADSKNSTEIPLILQASTDTKTAYPDQMILVTVRLMYRTSLMDAKIMTPTVEGARVSVLNRDRTYQTRSNDETFQVTERTYAVIPEKAGPLSIPPIEVYGTIAEDGPLAENAFWGGGLFEGLTGRQREIRLDSDPISVSVLPKPANWKGWWLPAERIELTVQDEEKSISVGDSITRTIILTAQGTMAEHLPALSQSGTPTIKVYPSPDQRDTDIAEDGTITAQEILSVVLVPTAGGDQVLPEIKVPWFNVRTGKSETAVIPPKPLTIQGETIQESPTQNPVSTVSPKKRVEKATKAPQPVRSESVFWLYLTIATAATALLGGLGLGFFLFRRRHPRSYLLPQKAPSHKEKKKKSLPDLYPF